MFCSDNIDTLTCNYVQYQYHCHFLECCVFLTKFKKLGNIRIMDKKHICIYAHKCDNNLFYRELFPDTSSSPSSFFFKRCSMSSFILNGSSVEPKRL
mmetsp:Transcript_35024/g.51338  ORF Transcript_35024/g.51338 Transcript_35024/m.51338 type:complete len:97 (+) Transcript_35024:1815-2105(+)